MPQITDHFLGLLARWRAGLKPGFLDRMMPQGPGDRWDIPSMTRIERLHLAVVCLAVGAILAVCQLGCFAFAVVLRFLLPLRLLLFLAFLVLTILAAMAFFTGFYLLIRVIK